MSLINLKKKETKPSDAMMFRSRSYCDKCNGITRIQTNYSNFYQAATIILFSLLILSVELNAYHYLYH